MRWQATTKDCDGIVAPRPSRRAVQPHALWISAETRHPMEEAGRSKTGVGRRPRDPCNRYLRSERMRIAGRLGKLQSATPDQDASSLRDQLAVSNGPSDLSIRQPVRTAGTPKRRETRNVVEHNVQSRVARSIQDRRKRILWTDIAHFKRCTTATRRWSSACRGRCPIEVARGLSVSRRRLPLLRSAPGGRA